MPTSFPTSNDLFTEPSSPGSTALSSAGTGSRNHPQHHTDLGDAIEAMQAQATLLVHSHDGVTARHGSKLAQANTHQSADTDVGPTSIHHTLGTGANQAATGNHTHIQTQSHGSPDTDTATTALHHTLGTGANQAASGDHVHAHPLPVYFTSSGTFTKASYPGLYAVEVEVIGGGGGGGYSPANDASHWSFAAGGSGGAYAKALILASNLLTSETVTVGAAGVAGVLGTPNGGNGGSSSFGTHLSAGGGLGGASSQLTTTSGGVVSNRQAGGSPGGTYDVGIPGEGRGSSLLNYANNGQVSSTGSFDGGAGGGPYGRTTFSEISMTLGAGFEYSAASPGQGYGSGASGSISSPSSSAAAGAAATPGLVVVRLIY